MKEEDRLASLRELEILDTESEEAFDRLTRLAAEAIGTPVAITSLVDEARVWLKSAVGTADRQTRRHDSFCHHTVASNAVLVVEDASLDPRFLAAPLVVDGGVRFYAGAPVVLNTGAVVGAVCVLDNRPRAVLSDAAVALLRGLAAAVGHLLDLRRELIARRQTEKKLAEHARLLELAGEMAGVGHWRLDFATGDLQLSPVVCSIYGLAADEAPDVSGALSMYGADDQAMITRLLEEARIHGRGYTFDAQLRRANDGSTRTVSATARVERDADGCPATLIGVFRDVTDEKMAHALLNKRRVEADQRANRMRDLASTDSLTGLPNRRAFLERAEDALGSDGPISLAILDIDYFKSINDRFGHDGGDLALRMFGRLCAQFSNQGCSLGRIGGEEFAILMTGRDRMDAACIVGDLRRLVASQSLTMRTGAKLRLTFSAGLAEAQDGDDWQGLFSRADQALYKAKAEGRDRLSIAA